MFSYGYFVQFNVPVMLCFTKIRAPKVLSSFIMTANIRLTDFWKMSHIYPCPIFNRSGNVSVLWPRYSLRGPQGGDKDQFTFFLTKQRIKKKKSGGIRFDIFFCVIKE